MTYPANRDLSLIATSLAFEVEQLQKALRLDWIYRDEADTCDEVVRLLTTIASDIVTVREEHAKAEAKEPLDIGP
jgi:hypothetical protein